ncbi:hypothetical protein PENANT_c037G04170 [Penicillium antarcticum]|uniref:Zn(2)-C6 fungal-type domain-containing protein n=1 Tax=Penicillium antarcticum TaxID=416450 RepID=A0A1V6PTF0_9EURO|nr:hypothetical protein PENANT_c037G04170 [Penicillium antarcticum]
MKRKPSAETQFGSAGSPPKKQPRQDPVSCESCRRKKSKCDRGYPCGNCAMRKLECLYSTGGSGVMKSGSHTEERPTLDNIRLEPPLTVQRSIRIDSETQQSNRNEPLLTADWLETIVMGHRVPSAIPAPLRAELSQNQQSEHSSLRQNTVPGVQSAMIRRDPIAARENPATVHLPSYLPPKAEALSLFRYYCNYLDFQYHLIIQSQVERQIETIYEQVACNESINFGYAALLFSIVASAIYYKLLMESSEYADLCSQETTFLAGAALIQGNYIAYPTIEGLQATMIIGHYLSNMNLPPSVSSFCVHRSFMSQATSMRLHLVDSSRSVDERAANGSDKTNVELRRRLWWDLATYDCGPQEGTYTVQPQHMKVREPLNVDDKDIEHAEAGLPLSSPTDMSYSLCRMRLAVVCRHIVDETAGYHLNGQEVPYEKILELDRELHKACAGIPSFFRFDQISRREFATLYRERPTLAWQRSIVQQGYHSRLCRLHRHYFVRGSKDPRYSYSHVISLQSARKILEVKRMMDEQEPVFTPHSSMIWSVMHHVFMAAVILLIDVCFNWDDILAEKRKEEVLDACRMLSRAQQSSPIAREGISAMMDILRKHCKQEKRPISSGSHADPPASSISNVTANFSQADLVTATSLGPKRVCFAPQVSDCQPILLSESVSDPLPLEDMWTEMLDGTAYTELETPDWTDLLTELTNVTMPCE